MNDRKIHGCIDKGLYFKSRKEAEHFIKDMSEISDTYGFIFCTDILEYFGEDCEISHDRYGWFDVRKWFVHPVGYLSPYIDHPYRVQLNRPVYYDEIIPLSQQKLKPQIKNIIFNDPATIVFWSDGTKTVVKTQDCEPFDPEKGLAMAISKKALGNNREYYHTFLHWLKKYEKDNVKAVREAQERIKTLRERLHSKLSVDYIKKQDAVQKAYDLLVKYGATEGDMILNEVIGYLGEALED